MGYECERGAVSGAGAEAADHTATVHIPTMTLKKCGFAGSDRDDIDDGSPRVEFCPHLPQCPEGLGSCGDAVPVIHLVRSAASVWLHSFTCSIVRSRRDSGEALFLRTNLGG